MSARIIHEVISIDPLVVSGTPVFVGTRVPVYFLFDYFQAGNTVAEFLDQYPTVSKKQIDALLNTVGDLLKTGSFDENSIG